MLEVAFAEGHGSGRPAAVPGAAEVVAFAESLAGRAGELGDTERIDLVRALEQLKCAAEGAQAVVTADFDASQRRQAADRGEPRERQGRGVAHQVALARRVSPHKGQRLAGLAKVLATEMPHTLAALRGGHICEWKATLIARETACLSLADRRRVDRDLCSDRAKAERMGVRETGDNARKLAAELDPASVAERRSRAEADRCVTIRPAPDTMTWLTGHLPVKQGVAVYAALKAEAERLVGTGDGRSRSQIMADMLVGRVLGESVGLGGFVTQAADGLRTSTSESGGCTPSSEGGGCAVASEGGGFAAASGSAHTSTSQPPTTEPGVRVNVVIGVDSLLGESDQGAEIPGYGPVPAETVRGWIREGLAADAAVELRRLFADARTGELVQMESRARQFPGPLAEFIGLRDVRCRTPWCDAPVRHADHVVAHDAGGPTSGANGQGLCESCNYAKQAVGWEAHPRPGPGHEVETITPTGHTHRARAPSLIGAPGTAGQSRVDLFWAA